MNKFLLQNPPRCCD